MIAVIGTYNSGCAEIEIPIANRAPGGPLAMISPENTYVGLTHAGPGTAAGEPGKFYPTGKRNYARLLAADDYQGASNAMLAKQLGYRRVFVLNDREAYGVGVAAAFRLRRAEAGPDGRRLHVVGSARRTATRTSPRRCRRLARRSCTSGGSSARTARGW